MIEWVVSSSSDRNYPEKPEHVSIYVEVIEFNTEHEADTAVDRILAARTAFYPRVTRAVTKLY